MIPPEKAFTYDYVFPTTSSQAEVYENAVSKLVQRLFKGRYAVKFAVAKTYNPVGM